jgi:hypothetical protein
MAEKDTKPTRDEMRMIIFNEFQAKKAEVANAERPVYITNGQFRYSQSNASVYDITTTRDVHTLRDMAIFLLEKSEKSAKADEILGVAPSPFTWLSFKPEEWFADLKTRASILEIAKRRAELVELEKTVNSILTPEMIEDMKMASLQEKLGIKG